MLLLVGGYRRTKGRGPAGGVVGACSGSEGSSGCLNNVACWWMPTHTREKGAAGRVVVLTLRERGGDEDITPVVNYLFMP